MRSPALVLIAALVSCAKPQRPPPPGNVVEEPPPGTGEAAIAAEPAGPPLPAIPDSPAPAPASLFAVVGVADPAATLAAAGQYADAAYPGLGAFVTTQLIEMAVAEVHGVALAGVDYGKPMWALVLDPAVTDTPLLVVAVADRAAFDAAVEQGGALAVHHRGFAALGSRRALDEAAPHALSSVALGAAPALPTATVDVARVMDRYGSQLASALAFASARMASRNPGGSDPTRPVFEGLVSLLRQTEQITVTVDTAVELSIIAELVPKADATIAGIFARQPEATFDALVGHDGAGIVFGGKLDWESLQEYLKPFTDAALAGQWGEAGDPMQAAWAEMFPLMTGEMGYAMHVGTGGTTWMAGQWGISDPKKVRAVQAKAVKAAAAASAEGAGPFELTARKFTYKRVPVTGTTMKPRDGAPAESRDGFVAAFGEKPVSSLFAVVDKTLLMAMGEAADQRIKAGIDAVKAKKPAKPSAELAAAIAAARDRKESLLSLIDFASFTGAPSGAAPVAIGVGFTGGRLSVRVAVPADQVRQLVQRQSAIPAKP